jgi:hypothetical protein
MGERERELFQGESEAGNARPLRARGRGRGASPALPGREASLPGRAERHFSVQLGSARSLGPV